MARIAVVGSATIDIAGLPFQKPRLRDSNPGRISVSVGGVGGNIARNLSRLGHQVIFISVIGTDYFSGMIRSRFEADGIDLSQCVPSPDGSSSLYLYTTDETGEMQMAIADMECSKAMDPKALASRLGVINSCDALMLDANLEPDSLRLLIDSVTVPIFADGVSADKVRRLLPVLDRLTAFKPNLLEAEILTGKTGEVAAGIELSSLGVKNLFITLGSRGVYCRSRGLSMTVPPPKLPAVCVNGAGDAFTAGMVTAMLEGMEPEACCRFSQAAAAAALSSRESVAPDLSRELIEQIIKKGYNNE